MQIADTSQAVVTLNINEVDILGLEVGQAANITFDAMPDYEATGTVHRIATASSAAAGASALGGGGGIVTYPVEVLISSPSSKLKLGMTASVEIVVERIPNSIIVNALALHSPQGNNAYVTVLDADGMQREVSVQVVSANASQAAVKGDIKAGDVVVLTPGSADSSGMSITLSAG
jgi:multidrug efflux pump subunit AcrA (membrane-fusion protein)